MALVGSHQNSHIGPKTPLLGHGPSRKASTRSLNLSVFRKTPFSNLVAVGLFWGLLGPKMPKMTILAKIGLIFSPKLKSAFFEKNRLFAHFFGAFLAHITGGGHLKLDLQRRHGAEI